jgi:sulfoxide reductase heme-binding subunit YedZ
MLLPLAVTSNDLSIRKLGGALWRRVHWLTYPASVLVIVHYIWLTKGFPYEPLVYGGIITVLFAARIRVNRRKTA